MTSPIDRIDRREALRRTALLLGGALSAPTAAAMLAACESRPARAARDAAADTLSSDRQALLTRIADLIIPETDTPGAVAAGVPAFIQTMLAEYYAPDDRARFLAGLDDVDARARRAGAPFLDASPAVQHDVLVALDDEAYRARVPAPHPPFFRVMKELTLLGYYTSYAGATRELRYEAVPGRFDGCVPVASVGRAWAT